MGQFVTGEAARERITAALAAIDDAHAVMRQTSSDEVGSEFRVEMAERLETQERTNRGLMYRFFGEIADPPDEAAMVPADDRQAVGAPADNAQGDQAPDEGGRADSAAPPAQRPAVGSRAGGGGRGGRGRGDRRGSPAGHHRCDGQVALVCVARGSRRGGRQPGARGGQERRRDRQGGGSAIDEIFNPDGDFDEADRARRRGLVLGRQGRDGMSRLSGWIDPETRCYVEASTAAVRPGRHLPDGTMAETPDDRSRRNAAMTASSWG